MDPDDLRFDHHVVEAADHDEMLDIVAPNQNQLPLTVEAEGVDQAQSRLPRPSPAWQPQAAPEKRAINDRQSDKRDDRKDDVDDDL
jgi:hypothetical protein